MIRMLSGPSLVSATTERGTPSASAVVVAMRSPGSAAAMRAAASSCASSSAAVKAGFVIFTTPDGLAVADPGEEVLVLLAAERRQVDVEPPLRADDLGDLGGREVRRRQLARAEEVEPDRAGGPSAAAVHAHPFPVRR